MQRGVKRSRGQIWVETVIYTLIAFAMIGLALAFIKPKIDEIQDKSIIDQSIRMLEDINSIVNDLGIKDPGNQRIIELGIMEGTLEINGTNNLLIFETAGEYAYSEPGQEIETGNVVALTEQSGELYTITLKIEYENYNLKYEDSDAQGILNKASTPYNLLISRQADDPEGNPIINFEVIN